MKQGNLQKRGRGLSFTAENYLMMLPYLLFFFVFTLLPVVLAIGLGFTDYNMLQLPKFVGWENYLRMFVDDNVF